MPRWLGRLLAQCCQCEIDDHVNSTTYLTTSVSRFTQAVLNRLAPEDSSGERHGCIAHRHLERLRHQEAANQYLLLNSSILAATQTRQGQYGREGLQYMVSQAVSRCLCGSQATLRPPLHRHGILSARGTKERWVSPFLVVPATLGHMHVPVDMVLSVNFHFEMLIDPMQPMMSTISTSCSTRASTRHCGWWSLKRVLSLPWTALRPWPSF